MFCIVNLLTSWLFQPEAPGHGHDTAMVATIHGEPSDVKEIAEGQTQAESPQDDTEADADAGKAGVWGSGV
jgi:hypothetical protein